MSDELDPTTGGAIVQDDGCAAASIDAQHRADQVVSVINLVVSEMVLDTSPRKPMSAHLVMWNEYVRSMFGPPPPEPEEAKPDGPTVYVRVIRGYGEMRRRDIASIDEETAATWIRARIAKRISKEEFDGIVDYQTRSAA